VKFLKLLGKVLLALVGCVVLLYLIALAMNWRDAPPSAEWRRLHKILDDRPAVPVALDYPPAGRPTI
jgi:hypothetical protein